MKKYYLRGILFLSGSIILSFLILLGNVLEVPFISRFDPANFLCGEEEIYRKSSSDNVVDVVISETNCGATTSIGTRVYIVPKGKSIDNFYPVLISDHVANLKVEWIKPKLLAIDYTEARIFHFKNFWQYIPLDYFSKYEVIIRECQNDENFHERNNGK